MKEIKYIPGDATQPVGEGNKIIAHICNDVGAWGAGFVMALSKRWTRPEKLYERWFHRGVSNEIEFQLGNVQIVSVEDDILVANMIAQESIMSRQEEGYTPIRYDALTKALTSLGILALRENCSVHMPRIGTGLAGGKWEVIEPIIIQTLTSIGVDVTVYDFD